MRPFVVTPPAMMATPIRVEARVDIKQELARRTHVLDIQGSSAAPPATRRM